MDTTTLTTILIAAFGALILAMWGLLRGMVSNRLDRIEDKQDSLVDGFHELDKRVFSLEEWRSGKKVA